MARRLVFPTVGYKYKKNLDEIRSDLKRLKTNKFIPFLEKYGEMGVAKLSEATPRRTGKTAESWYYEITQDTGQGLVHLTWKNGNLDRTISIALLIQYGHFTKRGTWVEGVDYINPALKPVFEEMADEVWREVTGKYERNRSTGSSNGGGGTV